MLKPPKNLITLLCYSDYYGIFKRIPHVDKRLVDSEGGYFVDKTDLQWKVAYYNDANKVALMILKD